MQSVELNDVTEALARQDWQAAHDAAAGLAFEEVALEAARAEALADASWWLGRLPECIEARELAHRCFDQIGDDRRAGQSAVWLYEHYLMAGKPTIASAWLRRARNSLNAEIECVEQGNLILREAELAHSRGEFDEALLLAECAEALGRSLRSPDLQAEALQTRGRLVIDRGDAVAGMALLDDAMLFAVEGRLGPYSTGKVYCSLISACEELGELDRAAEWTEATMTWAQRHPFAIFPGICRVHRAVVLKRRGSLAEAEREARLACDELGLSHVGNCAAAFAEVGDIRRRLGDLDNAERAFERATKLQGGPSGGLALLRLAQGRVDAADSVVKECLRGAGQNRLARAALLPVLAQVAVAQGALEAARIAAAELEEVSQAYDTQLLRASAHSTSGRVQLADGEPKLAAATLLSAVAAWEGLGVPYEVATARTMLGQALREVGDEQAAVDSFRVATALFEQMGALLDARQVDADLRPKLPNGLTEREVAVLRLIAAGQTNNEVAAELYLSAKTVSRHLSNIFRKIGVSSRAAATAFAFEHDLVGRGRS